MLLWRKARAVDNSEFVSRFRRDRHPPQAALAAWAAMSSTWAVASFANQSAAERLGKGMSVPSLGIRSDFHGRSSQSACLPNYRKLKQRQLKAHDQLRHEGKVERVDGVAGEVVVRIAEKGRIRDHQGWPSCIPERGVIAQAR